MRTIDLSVRRAAVLVAGVLLLAGAGVPHALAHTALQGHVHDASDNPISGAWVYAYDGTRVIYGLSDATGFYDLTVFPGTWSVTALMPGFKTATGTGVNAIVDTHNHAPEFKLETAPPFPIVKAAAPIPLGAGIDAAEFADAPEIRMDQPYSVVIGLDQPDAWKGPQTVSGRFKVKWDEAGLYYAGEVIWEAPGLNSHTDAEVYNGDSIEFYVQTAPYDRNRTAYEPDQNWDLVLGVGPKPAWWLFGAVNARPNVALEQQLAVADRPGGDGILFRLNAPWSMLLRGSGQGTMPPAPESLGALGIAINAADPTADRANTTRKFQLSWPMSDTNYTDPSYMQPVIFTAKAP